MRRWVFGLLAALPCGGGPALAQQVSTEGAVACAIEGYGHDRDPAGTNVRTAPHAGAPVPGALTA